MDSLVKKKLANLPEQVVIEEIKSSSLMYNGSKRYSLLSIGSTSREPIIFQTPIFEKAMNVDNFGDYGDYYYVVPDDNHGNILIDFIQNLEKHVIDIIFQNKLNWFPDIDNVTFRSLIKNYTDEEGNVLKVIKFKIPYETKTNKLTVESLDNLAEAERVRSEVKKIDDGFIRMIVNVNAIWLTKNMFGIYLRPICIEEIQTIKYEFEFQNVSSSIAHYIDSEIKENIEENKQRNIGRILHGSNDAHAAANNAAAKKSDNRDSTSSKISLKFSESENDDS